MNEKIKLIKDQFDKDYKKIASNDQLEDLRLNLLGRKGEITKLLGELRNYDNDQKPLAGKRINELKVYINNKIEEKKREIIDKNLELELKSTKKIDITAVFNKNYGSLHPITITSKEVEDVFISMGFVVEDGQEVVTEYENFESVNIHKDHPARDMQDTFYLGNGQVLKTHTSASQNRILRKYKHKLELGNDIRAIFPGRCFRNENVDASHENTFFQLEGILVSKEVSISNLIYFMKKMIEGVFKKEVGFRLRPGYFPFTEPSFELDSECPFCDGKGCSTCSKTGWIELCPCGMIHPKVLEKAGIDSKEYSGFAFGLGLTRLVMLKYGLKEIRSLNSTNIKILKQVGTR